MDNFSTPERRQVVDLTDVNRFLAKMYGLMALAVFVSAVTAYLTMTSYKVPVMTFFGAHPAMLWLTLLVPVGLSMGISFKATRNPVAGTIMLMLLAITYGFVFALIAGFYTGSTIATAFVSAAAIFVGMAVIGTTTKRSLDNIGAYARAALIGLIVALVVNLFLQNPMIDYVFSIIAVVIFTALTAYDAQKMKELYLNYGNQVSATGLATVGALQLYLDFINLFIYLLEIFGVGGRRN